MTLNPQASQGKLAAAIVFLVVTLGPMSVSGQITDTPADRIAKLRSDEQAKPYQFESRIHLLAGGDEGYLVVKVKLPKDKYLYSLTQPGRVPPTKLKLEKVKGFRLAGKFSPDKPPKVIPKDPVFGHAIEKHLGSVQFFAPIKLEPGFGAAELKAIVTIKGQVCGEDSCTVVEEKVASKFASYFQRSAKRESSSQTKGR